MQGDGKAFQPSEIIDFTVERSRHERLFGREKVFEDLDGFLLGEGSSRGWALVTGGPGMGKSAILSHYLDRLEKEKHTCAYHFLRRGFENSNRPDVVIRCLSAQIERIFEQQYDPETRPESRLINLLTKVSKEILVRQKRRLILVIDGLDEAEGHEGEENPLPRFLPYELPKSVFILCASRPAYPHLAWVENHDKVHRIDLDDARWSGSNEQACLEFWTYHAARFKPGLSLEFVNRAVECAEGNLLHAVKLREWLSDQPPEERRVELIPRGLAGFIEQIWQQLESLPSDVFKLVTEGLGLLCAAKEALPLSVLEGLLGWSDLQPGSRFLKAVRPFLLEHPKHWEGQEAYRPYHESFREFVIGKLGPVRIRLHHKRLADSLAAWPCLDGSDTFRYGYALRHAVAHRLEARDWNGVRKLCTDLSYLQAKCRKLDVFSVEEDLRSAGEGETDANR
ncbi:MAG: ATP-binding protein [bacterium]